MKNAKVVIVDDSPFSISIIRDILEENGLVVVGEAGNLDEVINVVRDKEPDIVTMDMTLPGTDGIECIKAINEINKNVKVIVISSMMDEEIVKKANENKVCGYIQKPIDPEELVTTIEKIVMKEELFLQLENNYFEIFKESFRDALNKFTKTTVEFSKDIKSTLPESSRGMAVVIGIIGNFSGRMILDLSQETANSMVNFMLKREAKDMNEVLNAIGEFTNIVAGNACSMLNRKNKVFGLRIAPPSIFYGKSLNISQSLLDSLSVESNTKFGQVYMNIGFERGEL
ncbi:response regulator [Clostridium sporogenes]|uniref:Stage 0 sporulation protein A homolog n=1 Tax=Clostridium botulinum TaxID=1491 RepID=A0A6M0T3A5_CLOBO|nr:response regulator [Clostridium sporogenes]NFA62297.1 response regulator [Clostridium botulinum]NFI75019.1 response regulator [Clostridium sporogenes]NFL74050.1 response regulator [Clostridium sporogenes]NFM25809.1 response regulator [Clostridium sporogenes]NFP63145.1 response regulator [Clostridium sporogenes]